MPPEDRLKEINRLGDKLKTDFESFKSNQVPVGVMESPVQPVEIPQVEPEQLGPQTEVSVAQNFLNQQEQRATQRFNEEAQQTGTVRALSGILAGRSATETAALERAGVPELETELADLTTRIRLDTDRLVDFDESTFLGEEALRGEASRTDLTKGSFGAQARERRLQRAVDRSFKASGLRAQIATAELMQNNITAATKQINTAMDTKYAPIEQALKLESVFLQRAFDRSDGAESDAIAAKAEVVAQQQKSIDDAKSMTNEAMAAGVIPASELEMFMSIEDPELQANVAMGYMAEAARTDRIVDRQVDQLELAIKGEQLKKLQSPTETAPPTKTIEVDGKTLLINTTNGEVVAEFGADQVSSNQLQQAVTAKAISDVDSLRNHSGLEAAVGVVPTGRVGIDLDARQDFIGTVDALTKQLTIDNLVRAKDQGATFGALSDGELSLLADAATKINSWRVEDRKNGRTRGFDSGEDTFRAELDNINNFKKLDAMIKGSNPEDIGVLVTDDGKWWTEQFDGTMVEIGSNSRLQ